MDATGRFRPIADLRINTPLVHELSQRASDVTFNALHDPVLEAAFSSDLMPDHAGRPVVKNRFQMGPIFRVAPQSVPDRPLDHDTSL